jgi:hypothetical protein
LIDKRELLEKAGGAAFAAVRTPPEDLDSPHGEALRDVFLSHCNFLPGTLSRATARWTA